MTRREKKYHLLNRLYRETGKPWPKDHVHKMIRSIGEINAVGMRTYLNADGVVCTEIMEPEEILKRMYHS